MIGLIILGLPFLILMIKFSWDQFYVSLLQNEGSESMTGLPNRYIVKSFMVLGFVVAFAAVVATILRLWGYVSNKEHVSEQALSELAIFSDQSTALAEAQRAAEEALEKERQAALAAQRDPSA